MEVSENFAFLKQEFPHAAESASYAERHVFGDPRASCFHARHALERLLKRVYKVEKALKPPKVTNLDGYISDPAFRELVPEVVWQKAKYIRQAGNVAVHGNRPPAPETALDVVRELYHVLYWTGRTYLRKGAESLQGKTFDESLVSTSPATTPASVQELEALKAQRDAQRTEARKEIESELDAVRERLAAVKAENGDVPETHDWNEDKTRTLIVDLDLERAGWPLDREQDREYEVTGMPNESGIGYADYVLWGAGCRSGEGSHRRAVLPEAGHWQHRRAVRTDATQGAAGDGHRQRQDPRGDRAGGPAATGGLGEAGVVPGRPGGAGEPSRWCRACRSRHTCPSPAR